MTRTECALPAERHLCQIQEVLRLLIERPLEGLTHLECEEATRARTKGVITVLRSHVSDLGSDHHWPIFSAPEEHQGGGEHARYRIYWERLEGMSGIPAGDLRRAAVDWIAGWGKCYSVSVFLEFAKAYRPKNPAADPLVRMILKSKKKVRRDDPQLDMGGLWAY